MKTEYSIVTTYENPAKTLAQAEQIFADLTRYPENDLIEVELVDFTGVDATSLKIWKPAAPSAV